VNDIENNNLKSIDISNDPGLFYLNASRNYLNQTEVDDVLQTLDSFNTRGGYLDLTGNAAPSDIGTMYANNLTSRQWNVQVSPKNNQPTANFTSNVISGNVPLTVQFNDTSINNPTTWSWDFGDETYSTEEFPTHVYTSPGSYTVTLGVRNPSGSDSKDVVITVLDQPVLPMANFSCTATESYVPLDVQFYDLSEHTAERYWNFGDGINSTELNPKHTYSIVGSYIANLTVSNANGTDSKTATISVLQAADSGNDGISEGSSDGSSRGGSSSGGGAGGSPEPQNNVEIKELSQTFITSGQPVKFEFPQKATAVVSIGFDSKKTVGKTTTIVEILENQSTLVSSVPSDEVYKYLNIWVGNGGYATDKNIGNAVVTFKVPKSWVRDKMIDKSSITLNRYSENTWNKLTTSLSNEDDSYLYFTTPAPGFSPFVITGKMTTSETGIQPITGTKTQTDLSNGSTASNTKQTPDQTSHLNTSEKENTKTPAFEISLGIICLIFAFWYKRR
jgi:PGF-pre-PGF domain-containing protein